MSAVLSFIACCFVLVVVVVVDAANLELYDDYVLLASDVQDWSQASSVFIIFGGNDESLRATTLMLHLVREFSGKRVLSLTANYTEILSYYRRYYKRILRPLIVVLLSSDEDVMSFRETTRAYDMSYPQWLVIFMDSKMELCKRPKGNVFNLKFDTNMLVKCYGDSSVRDWYSVHEVETRTDDLALWDLVMHFRLTNNKSLYERRHSIGGKVLRVATVTESPFIVSQSGTQSQGLFEKIIEELSFAMNFSYKIVYKETAYGILDPTTQTWSGVMGRIVDREADIGVAEITMTVQRSDAVDFTLPLILSRNRLYLQPPGGSIVQWLSYSRAFGYQIWLIIVVVQMLSAILITIMRLNIEKPIAAGHVSENYLAVWGTFCQQGLADFPTASPLRIAYFSLFMSSVVILAIYSACLISYLTVAIPSLPFNDLEGFVEIGSYQLMSYLGSADYNMFLKATDPTLVKMRDLMKDKAELPQTVMAGFQRVCDQKKVAFYTTEAVKEQLNAWLPCDLVSIDTGRFDSLGMVLTKGSPYTGVINYHLQKFKDCGIMTRLKRKYFMNAAPASLEYQSVTLRGIVPLIVVLLSGIGLGLFVFFGEKLAFRLRTTDALHRGKAVAETDSRIAAFKSFLIYDKYARARS